MDYPLWDDVSTGLRAERYNGRYLTPERYIAKNPVENLVVPPGVDKFFGTKVLNIFLVGTPYGWAKNGSGVWTESWPPSGLGDAVERHKATYKKFTRYKTLVYVDFYLVSLIMAQSSSSRFREMMDKVKTRLATLCGDLAAFGFVLKPDVTTAVQPSFFYPELDDFYANA